MFLVNHGKSLKWNKKIETKIDNYVNNIYNEYVTVNTASRRENYDRWTVYTENYYGSWKKFW